MYSIAVVVLFNNKVPSHFKLCFYRFCLFRCQNAEGRNPVDWKSSILGAFQS